MYSKTKFWLSCSLNVLPLKIYISSISTTIQNLINHNFDLIVNEEILHFYFERSNFTIYSKYIWKGILLEGTRIHNKINRHSFNVLKNIIYQILQVLFSLLLIFLILFFQIRNSFQISSNLGINIIISKWLIIPRSTICN